MREHTTKRLWWLSITALFGFSILAWLSVADSLNSQSVGSTTASAPPHSAPLELASTSQAKLPVSGVVAAADTAIIAAETGGVLTGQTVAEGDMVSVGMLLASQATPVADAHLEAQTATRLLRDAEQSAVVDARRYTARQAQTVASSAVALAAAHASTNATTTVAKTTAVRTQIEQGVTTLLAGLDFVQAERTLFADPYATDFYAIVRELYGHVPTQFRRGVTISAAPGANAQAELERLRTIATNDLSISETQQLAVIVSGQLRALADLLASAESRVFDEDRVDRAESVYEEYFTQRSQTLDVLQGLESALEALHVQMQQSKEAMVQNQETVAVSQLDAAAAQRQVAFAQAIAAAAREAEQAAQAVPEAEAALGHITAPFAGVVGSVYQEVGEYVAPGTPILSLLSNNARELPVTIPTTLRHYLTPGTAFVVDGDVWGTVDRVHPVDSGYATQAIISLGTSSVEVGQSLRGELQFTAEAPHYIIPRPYVFFTGAGPIVRDPNDRGYPIEVEYDFGAELLVRPSTSSTPTQLMPNMNQLF